MANLVYIKPLPKPEIILIIGKEKIRVMHYNSPYENRILKILKRIYSNPYINNITVITAPENSVIGFDPEYLNILVLANFVVELFTEKGFEVISEKIE